MKQEEHETFDPMLFSVKALSIDENIPVTGFYVRDSSDEPGDSVFALDSVIDSVSGQKIKINRYSLCRCSGFRIRGELLYEGDLIKFRHGSSNDEMGAVIWMGWPYHEWSLNINYDSHQCTKMTSVNLLQKIGNIVLSDADSKKFQKYTNCIDANYHGIPKDKNGNIIDENDYRGKSRHEASELRQFVHDRGHV